MYIHFYWNKKDVKNSLNALNNYFFIRIRMINTLLFLTNIPTLLNENLCLLMFLFYFNGVLLANGKLQKKVLLLMAGPLRGG